MKKVNMLILSLSFSFLALSFVAVERVGFAQHEMGVEGLACSDLKGCLNSQSCGMRGTPNGCTLTCQDETVITCPKASEEAN
jgi:hypothetical protein